MLQWVAICLIVLSFEKFIYLARGGEKILTSARIILAYKWEIGSSANLGEGKMSDFNQPLVASLCSLPCLVQGLPHDHTG